MKVKILFAVTLLIFIFCLVGFVSAQTLTDAQRQALIAQIQQQLASLTQQLQQMLSQQQGTNSWCYTFNVNLGFPNSGTNEVANLHIALQEEGLSYSPDSINVYSTGTSQAVTQFQTKYGIYPATGYVGIKTRAKLNQLYSCGNSQNTGIQNTGNIIYKTNDCNATCVTQSDGTYAIDCSGNVGKCDSGEICRQTYDTSYTYNDGGVQTVKTLTGTECDEPQNNCNTNWTCSGFGSCINGNQTQTCTDSNNCGTTNGEPSLTQSCTVCLARCITNPDGSIWATDCSGSDPQRCTGGDVCQLTYDTENNVVNGLVQTTRTLTGSECTDSGNICNPQWNCGSFGSCVNNQQTRICTDSNSCGIYTNEPITTQSCVSVQTAVNIMADGSDGPIPANGATVDLTWTSTNATSCSISGSGGWTGQQSVDLNGSWSVQSNTVTSPITYTITCSGTSGTATDSVLVNPGS